MAKFDPSPHKDEAIQALQEGATPEEVAARFKLAVRTVYRYKDQIENPKPQKPAVLAKEPAEEISAPPPSTSTSEKKPASPGAAKQVTGEAKFATIAARQPAPIVFIMGDQKIDLDPADLYDAWRYYEDIKRIEPAMDDPFSLAVKISMKQVWERFSKREAARVGVNIEEE